jgi:hypothetical protein
VDQEFHRRGDSHGIAELGACGLPFEHQPIAARSATVLRRGGSRLAKHSGMRASAFSSWMSKTWISHSQRSSVLQM